MNASQRIAAIDFGTVRIGVATADLSVGIATPLETYTRSNEANDLAYFQRLAEEERLIRFVVGLPVHLDGGESQKSRKALAFGHWLQEATSVPVEYFDERYTTVEAEQMLSASGLSKKRRRAKLDQLAAQILLTAYLEAGGRGNQQPGGIE